jgi:hypothetical protein
MLGEKPEHMAGLSPLIKISLENDAPATLASGASHPVKFGHWANDPATIARVPFAT